MRLYLDWTCGGESRALCKARGAYCDFFGVLRRRWCLYVLGAVSVRAGGGSVFAAGLVSLRAMDVCTGYTGRYVLGGKGSIFLNISRARLFMKHPHLVNSKPPLLLGPTNGSQRRRFCSLLWRFCRRYAYSVYAPRLDRCNLRSRQFESRGNQNSATLSNTDARFDLSATVSGSTG